MLRASQLQRAPCSRVSVYTCSTLCLHDILVTIPFDTFLVPEPELYA